MIPEIKNILEIIDKKDFSKFIEERKKLKCSFFE